jgi:hypothetical protein
MSYHGCPYPRTDNTFNQKVVGPTVLDRGHECLLVMIAYDSIGQWAIVRED